MKARVVWYRPGAGLIAVGALAISCAQGSRTEPAVRVTAAVSVPSTPCLLGAPFNPPVPAFTGTTNADGLTFSQDGLTAYVSSRTSSNYDVYVATRPTVNQPFSALNPLFSGAADERAPSLSQDGLRLYISKMNGWNLDVAVATRTTITSAFNAPQLIMGINTGVNDQDPFFLGGRNELYFSSERPNGAQRDLYVTTFDGVAGYSMPAMVGGVSSPSAEDIRPVLSSDGLTLYFGSTRSGLGGDTNGGIFVAQRPGPTMPFGAVTNLVALDSSGVDFPVALSENGCTLYFASNRETGLGNTSSFRLYQATRGLTMPAQVTVNLNIVGFGSVTTPPFNCSTGNVGTCSAQGAPDSTVTVFANHSALWTGSCTGNNGNPSGDGVVVFTNGGVCNVATGQLVRPTLSCVANDSGTLYALFGYENASTGPVEIPLGANNQISSATNLLRPPTTFQPGAHGQLLPVRLVNGVASWSLGGTTVQATPASTPCPPLGPGETFEENDDQAKLLPPIPGTPPAVGGTYVETSSNGAPLAQIGPPPGPLPNQAEATDPDDPPTLALQHDNRGDRSVEVVIVNATPVDFTFISGLVGGLITTQPPTVIRPGSYGTIESRDGGLLQGTNGFIIYRIQTPSQPLLNLVWNNPELDPNMYIGEVTPTTDFVVDRVGGSNALATVFFIVRPSTQAQTNCPLGTMQWILDNLKTMEPPLTATDEGIAFITTPLKNSGLGFMAWGETGCLASTAIGRVKQVAMSTDDYITIDVLLDQMEDVVLTGTNKAIRIEVGPADPVTGLSYNPAHTAIMNAGGPASIPIGSRISFPGVVRIDHGHFLEVHPQNPITPAPACGGAGEPLYCNPLFQNIYTVDTGMFASRSVSMGRAAGRACFLISVDGTMTTAPSVLDVGSLLATIDETTGDWTLTATHSPVPNAPLRGQARCIAANNVSGPFWLSAGQDLPTPLPQQGSSYTCFLTGINGHWQSGGVLTIDAAVLSGGPEQGGAARCMSVASIDAFGLTALLNQAPEASFSLGRPAEDACFFSQIRGPFPWDIAGGSGSSVEMHPQLIGQSLLWTASSTGTMQGAAIKCARMSP